MKRNTVLAASLAGALLAGGRRRANRDIDAEWIPQNVIGLALRVSVVNSELPPG